MPFERSSILWVLYFSPIPVGVSTVQEDHLRFVFEMSDDFGVLPTFGVILAAGAGTSDLVTADIPGIQNIDPTKVSFHKLPVTSIQNKAFVTVVLLV